MLALEHLAEDNMLVVEPRCLNERHEELRSISVSARVGHGEEARPRVLEDEVLILELPAVDGLTASAIVLCEVATLCHEVPDDTVELAALEVQWLSREAHTGGAIGQRGEILDSLGNGVTEQAEDEATDRLAILVHVEEDLLCNNIERIRGCEGHEHHECGKSHYF